MPNLRRLRRFVVHQVLGVVVLSMLRWRRSKRTARAIADRTRHEEEERARIYMRPMHKICPTCGHEDMDYFRQRVREEMQARTGRVILC